MKNLLISLLKTYYNIDVTKPLNCPEQLPIPVPEKTAGEKLYEFCMQYYNTDPTPNDVINDEFACAEAISTILNKHLGNFPTIVYTPKLLEHLKNDTRFKETTEFKTGNIIISPTGSGAGRKTGHVGLIGKDGKILSNSSSTGLWFDKFDNVSWIDSYSRQGGLLLYIFELK